MIARVALSRQNHLAKTELAIGREPHPPQPFEASSIFDQAVENVLLYEFTNAKTRWAAQQAAQLAVQ